MSENKVQGKIFGFKSEEATGWRKNYILRGFVILILVRMLLGGLTYE